jgi:hypothetical protein
LLYLPPPYPHNLCFILLTIPTTSALSDEVVAEERKAAGKNCWFMDINESSKGERGSFEFKKRV